MNTPFTNVFERFAMKIKDYNLDRLYTSSVTDYNTYLKGFLLNVIPKFKQCETDLSDRDDTTMVFNNTLSEEEELILSDMMVLEWTGREVRKLENLQNTLGDADFKIYSGAMLLSQGRKLLIDTKEEIDSLLTDYSWDNIDFDGDFTYG